MVIFNRANPCFRMPLVFRAKAFGDSDWLVRPVPCQLGDVGGHHVGLPMSAGEGVPRTAGGNGHTPWPALARVYGRLLDARAVIAKDRSPAQPRPLSEKWGVTRPKLPRTKLRARIVRHAAPFRRFARN
jgi:hypothetical protein